MLDAAGVTCADVVKTTVFLADMADFAAMNGGLRPVLPDPPPARSTVGVAALPKGVQVEIEVVARARLTLARRGAPTMPRPTLLTRLTARRTRTPTRVRRASPPRTAAHDAAPREPSKSRDRAPGRPRVAVVLAAGLGTRMRSALPKVLHRCAAGRCSPTSSTPGRAPPTPRPAARPVVVVLAGRRGHRRRSSPSGPTFALQDEPRGTGDAVARRPRPACPRTRPRSSSCPATCRS